jgi:hypothetical protein
MGHPHFPIPIRDIRVHCGKDLPFQSRRRDTPPLPIYPISTQVIPDWRRVELLILGPQAPSPAMSLLSSGMRPVCTGGSYPPGGRRFVANKRPIPIQPAGDRPVEALFVPSFGFVLAGSIWPVVIASFQISCALRRLCILAYYSPRINSVMRAHLAL